MSIHSVVVRALGVLALVVSLSAWSQPYQYHVYIDSDQRATTGCTVSGGGQTFEGADYRLTATVSGNPPVVTTRTLAACSGGSFGAGNVLAGSYPVGLNNGLPVPGGVVADVIELSVARAQLPGVQPLVVIGFGAASASGSVDVLYTANGQVGGPPMVVGFAALIPTLGFFGGLLLALALAALALRALKHNRRLAQMLLVGAFFSAGFAAWAANFIADGQVGDWSGSAPVGMDAIGDSVPNLSATDIVGAFAADENRNLYFRIDVVDAENRPPLAVGDAYTTLEDTALSIAAPGVLGNDSDPDGNPITAQLVTGPTRGTLVLNANGSFVYTPNANANGSDSFSYNAFDGQVTSLSPATVTIAITPVNDVPVFTAGPSQTVLEDAGPQVVNPWATGIDDGDPEVTQTLSFEVTENSNAALFSAGPAVAPTGVLSYTPAANANGSATITLRLLDDGSGTPPNVNTSATQTFTITVTAVNDAPTFTASNPPTVLEDAGAQSIPNWATFNPGPPDEAGQTVLGYQVSAIGNAALFVVPPTVAGNGTLSYTPAANANGSSTFTVRVQDSGGTANGGIDLSAPQTFTINVTAINDAPSFVAGPNQTVNEDAGAQTVNPWATGIDDGDPEVTQTLTFIVTNNSNAALFSAGPTVSPTGVLSYTSTANANGSATITLRLEDNGSNTPPNANTSATQTFTITVNAVNDAPSFIKGPDQTVNEDAPAQTVNPWATAISAGPPDEAGQTLTFNITGNTNAGLFSAAPVVSPTGELTYAPAANANGVATITLSLSDNGANTPPNVNTSAAQTFTITVNAVNDAPVNTVPGAQTTGDGTPLVFSTANTNAISIVDLDAAAGILQVSFGSGAAANGTLTLANPGGVLTTLTGNGTEQVIATGTLTALNAALNGPSGSLTFAPVAGTSAARTITMITNDQGNTGSGGAQIATNTVTVNVDAAPVVSSTPANGATVANNAAITVSFNESVNVIAGITLNCGGAIALGGTTGSGVTSLNLTYTAPLPAGSCTLTVPAASVSDVDTIDPPNNPAGNFTATFSVDAAPALISSAPAAAAVVNTAQTVSFTYNEAVTDAGSAITLNCGGAIAGTITGSGSATLTFTPTNPLVAGASCTATAVAAQINDTDAFDPPQNPAANSTINFTVDAAPAFVSSDPAANGAVVGTGQVVSFTFDENVANLGTAITLNCGAAVAGAISGGGTPTLTFTPGAALTAGASCTATAVAAQIGDSDLIDPPQNPVGDVVRTFTVDVAPTVTTTNPTNGAINVGIANNLTVSFSEPVNFTASAFTLECPAATPIAFTVSGSGSNTATIDPTPATLPINTLCVFTVNAALVTDVDGSDPPDAGTGITTVSFTTVNDSAPSVVAASTTPNDGTTTAEGPSIAVAFSELVTVQPNAISVSCAPSGASIARPAAVSANVSSLGFAGSLATTGQAGDTCTLTVLATGITDDDAIDPPDQMVANYVSTYTIDAAPSVSSVAPATAATGVALNSALTVNFSEPITAAANAITLNCGGAIAGTQATVDADTLSFTPTNPLPGGILCNATVIATLITDNDILDPPNAMAANFLWSFATVDVAPTVVATTPADGATSVNPTGTISIDFSESVNFSTLANAANTSFDLECPVGTPANFTVVTASPNDPVVLNPDDNAIAGQTCTLTVLAAGITDADLADPPDNMVANFSATFSFGAVANDDTRAVTPHLTHTTTLGATELDDNDLLGAGVITSFGFGACTGTAAGAQLDAGAANGRLTINANGTYSYEPPQGVANATRTFCYTVTGGDTANVAFNIANTELVWFIDGTAAGGGNGTQAQPFQTLGAATAVDTANDTLFLADGVYTATITLEAGERLIGDGSSSTLAALTGIAPLAGSAFPAFSGTPPTVTCAGTCVTLATGNTLRGFTIGDSGAAGTDLAGTGFGTLNVAELRLLDNGRALSLTNGTINGNFIQVNASAGNQQGIALDTVGGSFTVTAVVNIGNVSGTGIRIANTPAGASIGLIGGTSVNKASAGIAVDLDSNNAGSTINTGVALLTAGAGTALRVNNSPVTIAPTSTSTLSATGGSAIDAINATFAGPSGATFASASATNTAGAADGINLDTVTGALTINGGAISHAGGTGIAFDLNAGSANVTYAGTLTSNVAARLIDATGRSGGTVTLSGNLSGTGASTGINIASNTGGTVTLSGTSKTLNTGANAAVTLTTNTGASINFTAGGLDIDTTSATGFNATGGATGISVTGTGNSITSTTGTALNVANTTIGASGLTFQTIASNGSTNGIVLNTTGALGGLSVTGTGAAGTGGTIQNKATGILMTSTNAVSLAFMNVQTSTDDGINGTSVNGMTLSNMVIANNGNAVGDKGIDLLNPAGALVFNTVSVTGSANDNVFIVDSDNTGGTTTLVITNGTYSSTGAAPNGNSGMVIEVTGTAVWGVSSITNATFSNNVVIGLQVTGAGTGQMTDFTVSNSTFTDTATGNSQEVGIDFSKAGQSAMTGKFLNNTFTGHNTHAFNLFTGAGAGTTGVFNARVTGNVVGTVGTGGSGSRIGNCMRVNINGDADATVLMDNNTLRECPVGRGIEVIGRNGTGGLDITLTNNNIDHVNLGFLPGTSDFPLAAIMVQSNALTVANTVRADVRGNTVPAGVAFDFQPTYIVMQETAGTMELVDSPPASANCTAQLTSINTGSAAANAGCALIAGPISTPPL